MWAFCLCNKSNSSSILRFHLTLRCSLQQFDCSLPFSGLFPVLHCMRLINFSLSLSFCYQDIRNNPVLCQPGWRLTNSKPFYPVEWVEDYWRDDRPGAGMPHKRYAEHLKKWAVRLVVDKDIYGVIQRDSLFSEGPKDIDRPWVAKFLINDVCELQVWPRATWRASWDLIVSPAQPIVLARPPNKLHFPQKSFTLHIQFVLSLELCCS